MNEKRYSVFMLVIFGFALNGLLVVGLVLGAGQVSGDMQGNTYASAIEYTFKQVENSDVHGNVVGSIGELYDLNGNVVASLGEKFEVVSSKGLITVEDKGGGKEGKEVRFGGYDSDKNFVVSNTGTFSRVSYSPTENVVSLDKDSVADVYAGNIDFKQITDAKIQLEKNGDLSYAEFTSKKGGDYVFEYSGLKYTVTANPGDKIIFDPKKNIISGNAMSGGNINLGLDELGSNTEVNNGGWDRSNEISAKNFQVFLDKNKNIQGVQMASGGIYKDRINNLDYSSSKDFSVFFDGRGISDYQGNAVSVFDDGFSVGAKGIVNIKDNTYGLTYQGKDSGVYTEYDSLNANFDVNDGKASVSNDKHQIDVNNGLSINKGNFQSLGNAQPFSVIYSKDGKAESVFVDYVKKDSKQELEATYVKEGKEIILNIDYLSNSEQRNANSLKAVTREEIQNAIDNELTFGAGDSQSKLKLARLYASSNALALQELTSYREGQEVFSVSSTGYADFGKITQDNGDGTFVVRDALGEERILTKTELAGLRVSKLNLDQTLGGSSVKNIEYSRESGQIVYTLADGSKTTEKVAVSTFFNKDYENAISYLRDLQSDKDSRVDATIGLAQTYQEVGDSANARKEYIKLTGDNNLDAQTRTGAYKGLISNYLQSGDSQSALKSSLDALEITPDDSSLQAMKKELTKGYLRTISAAINPESDQIVEMWKEKIGYDKKWYDVGLDAPIIQFYKGDIDYMAKQGIDSVNSQQRGILVLENLADRGYDLGALKKTWNAGTGSGELASQLRDAFNVQGGQAVSMAGDVGAAFENPDVRNLLNGAKGSFQFVSGKGYVDKSFLEKGIAEQILSDTNVKTTAIMVAAGYTVVPAVVTAGGMTSEAIGLSAAGRAIRGISVGGTTVGKILATPVTELPTTLKEISDAMGTRALIKDMGESAGATFGKTAINGRSMVSLEFEDVASVNRFMNENVLGTSNVGADAVKIVSSDGARAGQYILEKDGQQFVLKVAGEEVSDSLLTFGTGSAEVSQLRVADVLAVPDDAVEIEQYIAELRKQSPTIVLETDKYPWLEQAYLRSSERGMVDIAAQRFPSRVTTSNEVAEMITEGDGKITMLHTHPIFEDSMQQHILTSMPSLGDLRTFFGFPNIETTVVAVQEPTGGVGSVRGYTFLRKTADTKIVYLESPGEDLSWVGNRQLTPELLSEKENEWLLAHPEQAQLRKDLNDCIDAVAKGSLDNAKEILERYGVQFKIIPTKGNVLNSNKGFVKMQPLGELAAGAGEVVGGAAQSEMGILPSDFELGQGKFLAEVESEKLPAYSINSMGIRTDEALYNRQWNMPIQHLTSLTAIRDVANVGRAYDLETHMVDGRFVLFDGPAEGRYIWTLDESGNMNIGMREGDAAYKYINKGSAVDKILPHSALAGGERVFGAGEVVFKNGEVVEVNPWSGHYVDFSGVEDFNKNAVKAFRMFADSTGLRVSSDAKFLTTSPPKVGATVAK